MKKNQLLDTLKVLRKALEKNKEIPIREYICFVEDSIYASNDNFTISFKNSEKVKTPFAVNGPIFIELLEMIPGDTVEFTVKGTDLFINNTEKKFDLPIKLRDEFIWEEPEVAGIELNPIVAESMHHTLDTCSPNQALEGFARVCIRDHKAQVVLYSADGDALTRYKTSVSTKDRINASFSRKVAQMIAEVTPDGTICINNKWIKVVDGNYTLYGQNEGESEFDYEDIIKDKEDGDDGKMIEVPEEFSNELIRATIIAKQETSMTTLGIKNKTMSFSTQTPFGNVYYTMKTDHPNIEVNINAQLVKSKMPPDVKLFKVLPSCIIMTNDNLYRMVATLE